MHRSRIIAISLVVAALAAGSPATVVGQDYSSPESVVREYLAGIAAADMERVLDASSVDEEAEGYRLDLAIDRLEAYSPLGLQAPSSHPFFADVNRLGVSAYLGAQVRNLTYRLLLPDIELDETMYRPDPATVDDLLARLDPGRLESLTVVDIGIGAADLLLSDRTEELFRHQIGPYGADEKTERVALIEFEDELFLLGFTLLHYEDGWQVASQVAQLAGTDVTGVPTRVTLDEWEDLTSSG